MKKLKSTSGETLIETLVSLLIIILASTLFLRLTLVSTKMNQDIREKDTQYQEALSAAEKQQKVISSGMIIIDGRNYPVSYYAVADSSEGNQETLVTYSLKEGEGS